MATCRKCGNHIKNWIIIDGVRRNFQNRKYCLECSPFGSHNTRKIEFSSASKACVECGKAFSTKKQKYCASCQYKKRIRERNKKLYDIVGTACWKCGYDKGYEARAILDFHHVEKKLFNVSSREVATFSWDRVMSEAKKCVLLCCRCHREQQAGIISAEEIVRIWKEQWQCRSVG